MATGLETSGVNVLSSQATDAPVLVYCGQLGIIGNCKSHCAVHSNGRGNIAAHAFHCPELLPCYGIKELYSRISIKHYLCGSAEISQNRGGPDRPSLPEGFPFLISGIHINADKRDLRIAVKLDKQQIALIRSEEEYP